MFLECLLDSDVYTAIKNGMKINKEALLLILINREEDKFIHIQFGPYF